VLHRELWPRVLPLLLLTVVAMSVVVAVQTFGFDYTRPDGDPWNYLAAGERLNAGHPLYALSPGDRPVNIVPPYWTVPLLAPPPIAVFWRPLAMLGEPSMWLWGLAGLAAVVGSAVFLGRRGLAGIALLAVLALPLALTALSGNASSLMVPILIGAWYFRDRPWVVGTLVAVAGAVKLTPLVLVVWMIATGRWRALAATIVVGAAIFIVSFLGAGPGAYADWWQSALSAAPSPNSLATLTGLPTTVLAVLLTVPVLLAWRRDRLSFGAAILAATLATPAFYFSALALLAALPVWRDREAIDGPG
jgi:alpha-1,2-mannosyltransferase